MLQNEFLVRKQPASIVAIEDCDNAWAAHRDRTAYLSTIKYGKPSYEAQMNNIRYSSVPAPRYYAVLSLWWMRRHNFIIANYGASQGFDTDGVQATPATPSRSVAAASRRPQLATQAGEVCFHDAGC